MKKINNWFNKPAMSIFFYVLAVLAMCYTAYTVYASYVYVADLVTQGSITWTSNIEDVFRLFITNSAAYLFYALAFVFFGYACNFLNPKPVLVEEVVEENVEEFDMDALKTELSNTSSEMPEATVAENDEVVEESKTKEEAKPEENNETIA